MPNFTTLTSRLLLAVSGAAIGTILLAPAASAAPSDQHGGNPTAACNGTHHSDSGHGANQRGAYDETCDGSPSGNGNGGGQATGKPCAGCVGNADDKNPPGQMTDGSDHNAGYECDRNHGVGRTNPAHTGCVSAASTPPSGGGGSVGGSGSGSNRGNGNQGKPPVVPPMPPVNTGVDPNGTPADPGAPVIPAETDPVSTSTGTAVLGESLVRGLAADGFARVSGLGPVDAAELPRTGGEQPDLLMAGLALVALGTALQRVSRRPARDRAW